jgi:hypothetical protein
MASLLDREVAGRAVAFVAVSAVVLTAGFVGVLGVLSGDLTSWPSRLPIYVLGMALTFVVAIFSLIRVNVDSVTAIFGAVGTSLGGLVVIGFAGEGVVYAVTYSGRVFGSQLLVYFLAAGLIGTGLGYWVLSYWRQYAVPSDASGR